MNTVPPEQGAAPSRLPRVLLAAPQYLFVPDPTHRIRSMLHEAFRARGWESDCCFLPVTPEDPEVLRNELLAWRMLDISESYMVPIDVLLSLGFPTGALRHRRTIHWQLCPAPHEDWEWFRALFTHLPIDPDPELMQVSEEVTMQVSGEWKHTVPVPADWLTAPRRAVRELFKWWDRAGLARI